MEPEDWIMLLVAATLPLLALLLGIAAIVEALHA